MIQRVESQPPRAESFTQSERSLQRRFGSVRRRNTTVALLRGLSIGVIVAGLAAALAAWLDLLWELTSELRVAALVAAVAAAVIVLAAIVGAARRRNRYEILARRLDDVAGSLGQILCGYELAPRLQADRRLVLLSPLSAGLARMAVARAAQLAGGVSTARAISARPAWRALAGVLALALAVGLLATAAPRMARTEWLRFSDPFGDHPPFSRLEFKVTPGDTRIVYGGALDIYATADGPAPERVELVLVPKAGSTSISTTAGDEEVLPMFPDAGNKWRALLTKVTTPSTYFVRAGRSRSHRYSLSVVTIPEIEQVRFRVVPPYEGALPQGGLAGLPGATVAVSAKSNRPLSGGTLDLAMSGSPSQVVLRPDESGGDRVSGSFTITGPGKFEVRVTDVDGLESRDSFSGAITLLVDEAPFIRLREPAPTSIATPSAMLPILLSGEDDYGISRIQLFRSLNASRPLPLEIPVPAPAATRLDPSESLPLAEYGLQPGDVIKLFARIEDNDPAGAKGSESPIAEVRIVSQEDFERMVRIREGMQVLLSKYRQAQRRLDHLSEEQEGLRKKLKDHAGATPQEMRRELAKLAASLQSEADEVRRSVKHLLPYDVDKNLSKHLERLAESLERMAERAQQTADLDSPLPEDLEKLLDQLAEDLAGEKKQLKSKVTEPLEHLEQIYPLIEDQAKFVVLVQRQRALAERLTTWKGQDRADRPAVKARMRDLAAEQRKLREALGELLDDIENHAARLPEDERLDELRASALKFADDVRASGATEAMTDAETALKAADILEKFVKRCQGLAGDGRACLKFQPGLAAALGETVAQLLAEAGLLPGRDGKGGGGYSTQRSSLDNVGLYGQLPGMDQAGQRNGSDDADRGRSGWGRDGNPGTSLVDPGGRRTESRSTGPTVPLRYRSRVGAYFQRILEEKKSDRE